MAKFGGVIFDLDGTLMDTLADLAASGNFALRQNGFAPVEESGYRYHVGNGMRTMAKRALEASLALSPRAAAPDDAVVEKLHKALAEHYAANWHEFSKPYPGIVDMLRGLAERGLPFAVCSNKPDFFVKEMVERYFAGVPFVDAIGQSGQVPLKPDATGALLLACKMSLPPEQVLFVGDTKTDMLTANRAGMRAVGVSWGFRPRSELLENGARVIVDVPGQILDLLG